MSLLLYYFLEEANDSPIALVTIKPMVDKIVRKLEEFPILIKNAYSNKINATNVA